MPRFYLDQVHQGECIRDAEGAEFTDLHALRMEAIAAAREIMAGRLIRGDALNNSHFEIRNDLGHIVMVMPFKDALPNDGE